MDNKKFQYQECLIAFLDILGFKNVVYSMACEDIMSVFTNVQQLAKEFAHEKGDEIPFHKLKTYIMSDSIVVYIDAKNPCGFAALVCACNGLSSELAKRETPIFLRGAIVKGDILRDKNIIFGKGLTEAYLLEESEAKFPRIIIPSDLYKEQMAKLYAKDEVNAAIVDEILTYKDKDEFRCIENEMLADDELANYIKKAIKTAPNDNVREKYGYLQEQQNRWKAKMRKLEELIDLD